MLIGIIILNISLTVSKVYYNILNTEPIKKIIVLKQKQLKTLFQITIT